MEKKTIIESEKYRKIAISLQDEIESTVAKAMTEQGVKVISFFLNGSDSRFDVDRAYAVVEDSNSQMVYDEVALVVADDEKHIRIATSADMENRAFYSALCSLFLDSADVVYSPKAWETAKKQYNIENEDDYLLNIEDTFVPTVTLIDIADTVKEVLEGTMEGKTLADGGAITID